MYVTVGYDALAETMFRKKDRAALEREIAERFDVAVGGRFTMHRTPLLAVRGVIASSDLFKYLRSRSLADDASVLAVTGFQLSNSAGRSVTVLTEGSVSLVSVYAADRCREGRIQEALEELAKQPAFS